jgi:hypothetical protein
MGNNEPLKELLSIAEYDYNLAKTIAKRMPIIFIDYEYICSQQGYLSFDKRKVSSLLLSRLDPKKVPIERIIRIKFDSKFDADSLVDEYVKNYPDNLLNFNLLLRSLRPSVKEIERDYVEKIILRLTKENLDFKQLLSLAKTDVRKISNIARRLLLVHFASDVNIGTLLDFSMDHDEHISNESIRILLDVYVENLNYANFVKFLSTTDKDNKARIISLLEGVDGDCLDYQVLLSLHKKFSHNDDNLRREKIEFLIKKINHEKFDVDILLNFTNQTNTLTTNLVREIIFSICKEREDLISFDKLYPYVDSGLFQAGIISKTAIAFFYSNDKGVTYELLNKIHSGANHDVKEEVIKAAIRRYPERLEITNLITYLGLGLGDYDNKIKELIDVIGYDKINIFKIIEIAASFSAFFYDSTPIKKFAVSYLKKLPKEVFLRDEEQLLWYANNGKVSNVSDLIKNLIKFHKTDYDSLANDFFAKYSIKSA